MKLSESKDAIAYAILEIFTKTGVRNLLADCRLNYAAVIKIREWRYEICPGETWLVDRARTSFESVRQRGEGTRLPGKEDGGTP